MGLWEEEQKDEAGKKEIEPSAPNIGPLPAKPHATDASERGRRRGSGEEREGKEIDDHQRHHQHCSTTIAIHRTTTNLGTRFWAIQFEKK
ncbi:hypothetical protein U1Q18_007098, partial [Sarracenia purpurea var. burkii]